MKRRLLGALFGLFSTAALAVTSFTLFGDANYAVLNTDANVGTQTAFTATRTVTLPFAGGSCVGQSCTPAASQLQIADLAGAISTGKFLTIAPQSGDTINGNTGSVTLSAAGARAFFTPSTGSNWSMTTNGDVVTSGLCPGTATTGTVTITIAAPGVVTWTAHGLVGACPVVFTTDGGLPTGITSGTTYWVVPSSIATNTFQVATTVANALAGTAITTSGSQSGTQTATAGSPLTSTTAVNITGLSLTQGDWDCRGKVGRTLNASTSVTKIVGGISQTSATAATAGTNSSTVLSVAANVMGAGGTDSTIAADRQLLTATTNLFLVAQDTFTVSTNVAYGALTCRRVR